MADKQAKGVAELLDFDRQREADAARSDAAPRTVVGRLVEWNSETGPLVDFPGNEGGPLPARSTVALDAATVAAAIAEARGVVLLFEDRRPDAPIITGVLQPLELAPGDERPDFDARVDGERVEIEGRDEIVLRCGKASITLRRNGRVVIRGTYVETRSRGVNRVKGGSVEIN